MATEDRTEVVQGELIDAAPAETNGAGEGKVPSGIAALKARVAAKRGGAAGKQEMIQSAAPQESGTASAGDSESERPIPADAGMPDNEITPAAKDELARLASIREAAEAGAGDEDDPERAAQEGRDGESGDVMAGLAAEGGAQGQSLYERRQAEIAEAKARPGGKAKGKSTAKGKAGAGTAAREREKEKKEREKAKAREKSEKAKEKETERKAKEKEKKARLKESEDARKKKLAEQKAQRAQERAAARVPDVVKRENKAVQAAFAEDYTRAGPKSDRNPNGLGLRRAKADRGDFAAGYVMAIRRLKSQGQGTVGGAARFAAAGQA